MVGTSLCAQIPTLSPEVAGMPALLNVPTPALQATTAAATAPEGEAHDYTLTCLAGGSATNSSLIQLIESGDKLYVSNFFPYSISDDNIETWAEGTIDLEAGTVTFEPQRIGNYSGYDIYLGSYAAAPEAFSLTINADGTYSNASNYIAAFAYSGEQLAGLLMYGFNLSIAPGDNTPKEQVLPEGLEPVKYGYHYHDLYNAEYTGEFEVAFDGTEVWFSGLTPQLGAKWIHGTLNDGIVSIELGQYIGQTGMYQLYTGAYSFNHDFTGAAVADEYCLVYDAETGIFTSYETEEKIWALMQRTANSKNYSYNFTFTIFPIGEPIPAKPANPTDVKISANTTSTTMNYLLFKSSLINEDGQYFAPENLYYRCYLDGEVYTFAAEEYSTIEADTDLIPWGLNDQQDFWMVRDVAYINLHEALFETLGIQIVYHLDGAEYCSDIYNVDVEGNITVVEVENQFPTVGITNVNQELQDRIYNLAGQRISTLQPGFNIVNGKVVLK